MLSKYEYKQLKHYFDNNRDKINDATLLKCLHKKSGKIAELFVYDFINKHFVNNNVDVQVRYNQYIFDFASNNIIYEVKHYMYDSICTADEKLLYGCFRYMECLNKYKNIIIILCAKFENIFINKYLSLFYNYNLLNTLLDNGIYISFCSSLINDFLYTDNSMTFIKWIGGKSKHIDKIISKFPKDTEDLIYVEPFLGSGSVLISFLETNPKIKGCMCSDANKQLITTFQQIKRHPKRLINEMLALIEKYNKVNDKEEFYYKYNC